MSDTRFNSDVERLVAAIRVEESPARRRWPKPSTAGLTVAAAGLVAVAGLGYFAATRSRPAREDAT